MVKKITHTNQSAIGIAACHFDLHGTAPTEIKLTPSGTFKAKDGRPLGLPGFVMNAANAQQTIAYAKSLTDDFVIDYEHQTLFAEKNGQPAPAGGWFNDLQWREGDGLYAQVQWTAAAKAAIEANEYRYISPVIIYDKKTGDVSGVQMAALVNHAAIDGLSDLTARAAAHFSFQSFNHKEDLLVDEETLALLGLNKDATPEVISKAVAALKAKADQAEQLQTDVAALKAKPEQTDSIDMSQFVPASMFEKLNTDFAALKGDLQTEEFDTLVQRGIEKGLLVADNKDSMAWAKQIGNAALKAYVDKNDGIAALRGTQTSGKEPIETKNEFGLNETDIAMCKNMNLSQEDYAKANGIEVQK